MTILQLLIAVGVPAGLATIISTIIGIIFNKKKGTSHFECAYFVKAKKHDLIEAQMQEVENVHDEMIDYLDTHFRVMYETNHEHFENTKLLDKFQETNKLLFNFLKNKKRHYLRKANLDKFNDEEFESIAIERSQYFVKKGLEYSKRWINIWPELRFIKESIENGHREFPTSEMIEELIKMVYKLFKKLRIIAKNHKETLNKY